MTVGARMLVPARRFDPEWMDRDGNEPADLEGALRDIRLVNRFLGGTRALLRALDPYLAGSSDARPLRVLDVGTGGGDVPVAIVERARERGHAARVTAIDRDPITAGIAARETAEWPEIRVVRADAAQTPFGPGSFDVVTASMFLHHFDDEKAASLLARWRPLARRAVLVNDLRRHVVPWSFIWLASRVARRHPMFRHDAPLSVLRGFTAEELARVGARAGATGAKVARRWPYRLVLTIPADGGAS